MGPNTAVAARALRSAGGVLCVRGDPSRDRLRSTPNRGDTTTTDASLAESVPWARARQCLLGAIFHRAMNCTFPAIASLSEARRSGGNAV